MRTIVPVILLIWITVFCVGAAFSAEVPPTVKLDLTSVDIVQAGDAPTVPGCSVVITNHAGMQAQFVAAAPCSDVVDQLKQKGEDDNTIYIVTVDGNHLNQL